MRPVLALALALVLALDARAEDLRVQKDWKVVGVAVATSSAPALSERAAKRALDASARTVARELPGLAWHVSPRVREARFDDRDGAPAIDGPGFARVVERLAAIDEELAGADVVFLFAPLPDSRYSGMSRLEAHPRAKGRVWYSVVNTRQGSRFARTVREETHTDLLARPLGRALDSWPLRELALHATVVHEFGHFLAPGTKDLRDAKSSADFIGNGEDEPEMHDLRCIMFTPKERRSLPPKLLAFPRVIQFCPRCRERVGCR